MLEAVRVDAELLGGPDFASPHRIEAARRKHGLSDDGMEWRDVQWLVHLCNRLQRGLGGREIDPGTRKGNLIKTSCRGATQLDLDEGVYLAEAFNHTGTGHMFVLRVNENGTLLSMTRSYSIVRSVTARSISIGLDVGSSSSRLSSNTIVFLFFVFC